MFINVELSIVGAGRGAAPGPVVMLSYYVFRYRIMPTKRSRLGSSTTPSTAGQPVTSLRLDEGRDQQPLVPHEVGSH